MTEQAFASLKRGDIIHHPSQPYNVWTVVLYQTQYGTWLAVQGRLDINSISNKFWDCASVLPEKDLKEAMECIGLKTTRVINPGNWSKEMIQ